MTDKEFKRLSRAQLIDIIYQFQLKQDELMEENEKLSKALEDKRIRLQESGNIAEAALEIHKVMEAAQNAANHYVEEMQLRVDEECRLILDRARAEAAEIITRAKQTAGIPAEEEKPIPAAVPQPRQEKNRLDEVEAILREYRGQ